MSCWGTFLDTLIAASQCTVADGIMSAMFCVKTQSKENRGWKPYSWVDSQENGVVVGVHVVLDHDHAEKSVKLLLPMAVV